MPWWYAVVEARHEVQNPTSPEKILLLGAQLGLGPSSRVLDVGAGRGGPAVLLAREFGCRITSVELSPEFAAAPRKRAADDPQADDFRARGRHHRERYLRWIRDLMGWTIFVCRTP